jgi:CheY-like chemotaxis protein
MEHSKSVLIIDDEPAMTTYLSTLLEDHGFVARVANDPQEGMERLQEARPDVILLDLLMPQKSGVLLFQRIARDDRFRGIPIIILTGIREHFVEDFREFFTTLKLQRPFAYLEKPVDPLQLVRVVKDSLATVH